MKHARTCRLGLVLAMAGLFANPAAAQSWRETVIAFAQKNLQQGVVYSHSERDYALAKNLAAADHVVVDDDVLFAAAYLHDMSDVAFAEPGKDHADVAATKIDMVLAGTDFPQAKLDQVRAAIRTHMFFRTPVGPEALYLHDADTLEQLGASGLARSLELVDSNGGKPTGPQMMKAYGNTKIIEDGVLSAAGKSELARRLAEQKAFLDALSRETDGFKAL